jgi:hypothetical protein
MLLHGANPVFIQGKISSILLARARAASGHVTTEPATTLMKSRRRICLPQGSDYAHDGLITPAFYDRRNGVQA